MEPRAGSVVIAQSTVQFLQEVAIKYGPALQSADAHLKFRDTIRGTAELQHGLLASSAPQNHLKIGIGSGAHLHFCLWSKDGVNLLKGREMQSINLKLKACDGSANPYLALAGVILAGLDGVEGKLETPMPAHRDPAFLTESEKIACAIKPLPSNQIEALNHLENDSVLADGLGPLMLRAILATRRAENAKAEERGEEWARLATFSTF